ncbi:hypothetical protein CHISP_2086 [Chitinispirillum alkaliphilum]|nr:hypothetical protein CHISP_2086 [Chitinispirillum alkaliphilum]
MLFIAICIAAFMAAFLLIISIQLIRIEKTILNITELSERHVKRLYGE